MSPPLTHSERREVQAHFTRADTNRDQRINLAEFRELLRDLGAGMSEDEVTLGFDEVDVDDDGFIDFNEFLTWWAELH
jgi:calmodulin